MKNLAIDFEYKHPANSDMGLISCAISDGIEQKSYWIWDPLQLGGVSDDLKKYLLSIKDTHVLIGYTIALAESRCFAAMGLDPTKWKWRDLMNEWKWLRNWDNKYIFGHMVTKAGFANYTVPPVAYARKKASQEELDEVKVLNDEWLESIIADTDPDVTVSMERSALTLLDCLYFFELINFDEYLAAANIKRDVRDNFIIPCKDEEIGNNRNRITDYNLGDIKDLFRLADKLTEEMIKVGQTEHCFPVKGDIEMVTLSADDITNIQLSIGDWCSRVGKISQKGLPIDRGRLNILLKAVPEITKEEIYGWNASHPLNPIYRVGMGENHLEKMKSCRKVSPYIKGDVTADESMIEKLIADFCEETGIDNWPHTRTGKLDRSRPIMERYKFGIIKEYLSHSSVLSFLRAFSEVKGEIAALTYIGSDDVQRPDYNPFGTQTARNGHKTRSLIPGNAHAFRYLINPITGQAIVCLDYGSEEIFIAASVSGDEVMKESYLTNDFYTSYAQLTGMYPSDLKIPTDEERDEDWFKPYKLIRASAKTLCLAMQFGAGGKTIAASVKSVTGDESIDADWGYQKMDEFRSTFYTYSTFIDTIREQYRSFNIPQILPNGWRLGPDNFSQLSAANFLIQGRGSCILMNACKRIHDQNIDIIFTMHDEIGAVCKVEDIDKTAVMMRREMLNAAEEVLGESGMKVGSPEIVLHNSWWTNHSGKAEKHWNRLKKYYKS